MTGRRSDEVPTWDLRSGCRLYLWWVMAVAVAGARGWEEGDDAVNVISVENMDALLGLRMVTELKAFEGIQTNETEPRLKRTVVNPFRHLDFHKDCKCNYQMTHGLCKKLRCEFTPRERIIISSPLPDSLEIHISNAAEVSVSVWKPPEQSHHANAAALSIFYNSNLTFQNIGNLVVSSFAFKDLPLRLEIKNCSRVTLKEAAISKPARAAIENCEEVILEKTFLPRLLEFQVTNVPKLELVQNTFALERPTDDGEHVERKILFRNVSINEIPNATFPLASAKIRFVDCDIRMVATGAFNGLSLESVRFERTRVGRIRNGAFSERTLVYEVEFMEAQVGHVEPNALSAAVFFTMANSNVEEVTGGAFNVSTAFFKLFGNRFQKIRRYAFEIQNWNSLTIEKNSFDHLEPDSFSTPFSNVPGVLNEFSFVDNTLRGVEIGVLAFIPNDPYLLTTVKGNVFEEVCHCHLESWIRERTGEWESFYNTSQCVISTLLEACYNVSRGHMNMKTYVEEFCKEENKNVCAELNETYYPNKLMPISLQNTERTVLGVIFLGVVCSVGIMLIILSMMWMKDKGLCGGGPQALWCNRGNLVTTNSISRINIHEYAEIQNQLNQQQKETVLAIETPSDNEEIAYENKATQTLPEELTQELIQSLREKLDDPENYTEARDMIEHLYDLIKVEESCNNNTITPRTSFLFDEDDDDPGGIYEVIQTRKSSLNKNTRTRRKGVEVISTGTRAPTPEKLSPITFNPRRPLPTLVTDYTEPRDRKSNEYCELPPPNLIMPDVLPSSQVKDTREVGKGHIYAEPLHPSRRPSPGTSDS